MKSEFSESAPGLLKGTFKLNLTPTIIEQTLGYLRHLEVEHMQTISNLTIKQCIMLTNIYIF